MAKKTIAHDPDRSRYELRLDGEVVGVADYRREGNQLVITHTGVEPHLRGRGLAGELIEFTLGDIRDRDLAVLPYCSFVSDYIARHREHLALVPSERHREFGL